MRKGNLLRLAADNVMTYIGQLIGNVLISIVLFLLIAALIIIQGLTSNIRRSLESTGLNNVDNLCYLYVEDVLPADALDIVSETSGVSGATYEWSSPSGYVDAGLSDIREIQGENILNKNSEWGNGLEVEMIDIDASIYKICNMELSEGTHFKDLEEDVSKTYLYLGSAYQDKIAVGTEYESNIFGTTYVVAGILKKGQSMPVNELVSLSMYDITEAIPLDYAVLRVQGKEEMKYAMYFSIEDGVSFTKVKRKIMQKLVQADSGDVVITHIGELIKKEERRSHSMNANLIQIIALVGIAFCIVLLCFQILSFLNRRQEYGIMLADGFSLGNIKSIILWENILKFFLVYGVSMLVAWLYSMYLLTPDYITLAAFKKIYWGRLAPRLAGLSVIFTLLATICPILMLGKKSPVELMGKGSE